MSFRRILKSLFGISGHDEKTNDTHQELDIANATPTQLEVPCFEKKQEQSHTPTLIIQEPPVKKSEIIVQKDSATEELQEIIKELNEDTIPSSDDRHTGITASTNESSSPKEVSLLDNAPFMNLAQYCCDLIIELDNRKINTKEELIDYIKTNLKEGLISSGADVISEDSVFDVLRHKSIGKSLIRKGTPIKSTIEPGISIGDKVLIKAIVEV